ncbi:hypothetical protein SEMRO_3224_G345550.1 [Seminavis robusta]|uniref:Uncharacterized protein n=1 Tax=Seminavis robusta TaxID=568900 RepID=A0A9N8F3N9_9STRA|nr:hypothetical protein SEMRO_3224_G345550.1 [Seminavis robusta]|eukprot:Sro3224_g345550.1 n/a (267) ;mRNA; r:838-1638
MCKPTVPAHCSPKNNKASSIVQKNNKKKAMTSTTKKQVCFDDTRQVECFVSQVTPENCHQIWYQADELTLLQHELCAMIKAHRTSIKEGLLPNKVHWRGLEHYQDRRPRKKVRRTHSQQVVYFYKMLFHDDPTGLGMFASDQSLDCSDRARELGLRDEQEALRVYLEEANSKKSAVVKDDDDTSRSGDTEDMTDTSCSSCSSSSLDETSTHETGWAREEKSTQRDIVEVMEILVPTKPEKSREDTPSSPKKKGSFLRLGNLLPFFV